MPELPEVEIQRRLLSEATANARLRSIELPDTARFEGNPSDLEGRLLKGWHRRGKYLVADFGTWSLLSHLGMTGQWILDAAAERPHKRVILRFDNQRTISLIDPRRFGWNWILETSAVDQHPRLASLGLDPLDEGVDAEALAKAVEPRRTALKKRLMDQKVVAGLGNIALSEIGWRAKLHPHTPCQALGSEDWQGILDATRAHLDYVFEVEAGDEIVYLGYEGAVNPFICYGRAGEPCPRCQTGFIKEQLSGRATYSCPACQPLS